MPKLSSKSVKKVAWTTVGFVYLLMVWGNLVSSTGSGLACPDWPLCHGTATPTIDFHTFFEWGHRLLAATASILILVTLYLVLGSPSSTPTLRRSGRSLAALLLLQVILGGTTVLLGLSPAVSTIHLLVATLVFSGLITVACVTTWSNPVAPRTQPKMRRLAIAGLVALLVQFALGALVRHTHAGLACPGFPRCLEGFFPVPFTFETAIAFIHRWWGFLLLGVFGHIAGAARKIAPEFVGAARAVGVLGVIQVLLGIFTVLSGLGTELRATHAAMGYGLWGLLFYCAIRAGAFRWLWSSRASA